jgi:hypothetical protein
MSERSRNGAKRNPGFGDPTCRPSPDFAALHPGYDAEPLSLKDEMAGEIPGHNASNHVTAG